MAQVGGLRKFVSPEVIFGRGARKLAGRYAQQYEASKALIVTDKEVIEAGWLKDIVESLEEVHIPYKVFSDVTPNPRATEVMEGAEIFNREGCNIIISIGGGSPMDCAKGIGIVSSNNKINITNFEGVDKIHTPVPPLIFVPTTAGTSADVSQFCIISNLEEQVKIAIVSKAIVPDVALIDPETTTTMDPYLTACTGIDALVHAIEAFVSIGNGPLTDMYAIEGIKLVWNNLPKLLQDINNIELREKMMLGSMKAGLAFSNASLGAVHAMAHSLGGFLDLPHGECNAMLLDHVINFNFDVVPERFLVVADTIGVDARGLNSKEIKSRIIKSISDFKIGAGITKQLKQKGVSSSEIPELSKKAIKDACMLTNPKKATKRDLEVVFEEAM